MGEEVDKRVMDGTDTLVAAFDALREAKLALDDVRLSSPVEAQRNQGFSQASNRVEGAAKKGEEALRKCIVAASVSHSPAHFLCYRQADGRLASARAELRGAAREDDVSSKAARLSVAVALIEQGLDATKDLIFAEPSAPSSRAPGNGAEEGAALYARGGTRTGA
ncbi:MAG TPA: hypothetical protein VKV26_06060 [Dehalococcoidia bacterium]|nr:hypothetical protein [Dehalococcoidia bacterium]